MRKFTPDSPWGQRRGASELVGVVLLFGLVLAGATLVVLTGSGTLMELQEENEVRVVEDTMLVVDKRITTLSQSQTTRPTATVPVSDAGSQNVSVGESTIEVAVNGHSACTARMEMGSIEYTSESGNVVAFEAGGVWRETDEGHATMVAPPDVAFRNDSLIVAVYNVTGTVPGTADELDVARDNATARTEAVREQLFGASACKPRSNVSVTVTSEYAAAWEEYLAAEFGVTPTRSGDTVTMTLDNSVLAFDTDKDGVPDATDNCPTTYNPEQYNTDNGSAPPGVTTNASAIADGLGDACDPNDDGDFTGSDLTFSPGAGDEQLWDRDSGKTPVDNCEKRFNPQQADLDTRVRDNQTGVSDATGVGDVCDPDDDGDGVPDTADNCPRNHNPNQSDVDGDGVGDLCDPDNDGDGVDDRDASGDRLDNCRDTPNPGQRDVDTQLRDNRTGGDTTGLGDACDDNTDGDWRDLDGDDVRDPGEPPLNDSVDNCPQHFNPSQNDTDGDGVGDLCDRNDDGDTYPGGGGPIRDSVDNCPDTPNPNQTDTDGQGRGDACDPDDDGDGIDDGADNCPRNFNPNQTDTDGDGLGDDCDPDDDGDGVPDTDADGDRLDNCQTVPNPNQTDTDGQGRGDACDPNDDGDWVDRDGDGEYDPGEALNDSEDNCPQTWNPTQYDGDGDGRGAACDPDDSYARNPPAPTTSGDYVEVVDQPDATDYRLVDVTVAVETPAGRDGDLEGDDVAVYSNGRRMAVEGVEFTSDRIDVVFVFDDTGSMREEIADAKENAESFAQALEAAGYDARYALVSFDDQSEVDVGLTSDFSQFERALDALSASGGDDYPEDNFDAIYEGTELDWRSGDTERVVIHITDAPTHQPRSAESEPHDGGDHRRDDVVAAIERRDVSFFSYSVSDRWAVNCERFRNYCYQERIEDRQSRYVQIAGAVGGTQRDIGSGSFEGFLEDVEAELTEQYTVTYRSCYPADGTDRDVTVYVKAPDRSGWASDAGPVDVPDSGPADGCAPTGEPPAAPLNDSADPVRNETGTPADDAPLPTDPAHEPGIPIDDPSVPAEPDHRGLPADDPASLWTAPVGGNTNTSTVIAVEVDVYTVTETDEED